MGASSTRASQRRTGLETTLSSKSRITSIPQSVRTCLRDFCSSKAGREKCQDSMTCGLRTALYMHGHYAAATVIAVDLQACRRSWRRCQCWAIY